MSRAIGGFLPLDLPLTTGRGANLLQLWDGDADDTILFHNARSALHHLLRSLDARTIWLPAYVCASVVEAAAGVRVRFYPSTPALSPGAELLARELRRGDHVLAIDYFGRNPAADFLRLVRTRRDVTWIEDRAQAMLPSTRAWGDWVLYSPRKLVGVPDGGILVRRRGPRVAPPSARAPVANLRFLEAPVLRYEDEDESRNETWHKAHTASERAMRVSTAAMSRITREVLAASNPRPMIRARKANYRHLWRHFRTEALFPEPPGRFVPMAFPMRVANAEAVANRLAARRIYAQRHWAALPSDAKRFSAEHALSRQLLSVPCDHRYSIEDMEFIVENLRKIL